MKKLQDKKCNYLKEENDVPNESQDDGGISICNVNCIDTDQLYLLTERVCPHSSAFHPAI